MLEFIKSIDFTAIKVVGMVISGAIGIVMSWISRRSVNYRKIDKKMLLAAVLYFVYLNALSAILGFAIGILIFLLGIQESFGYMMLISMCSAVLTIAIFWGIIIRKSKLMIAMMTRAKEVSRRLFLLINWISVISVVVGGVAVPFEVFNQLGIYEQRPLISHIPNSVTWILTIWWFFLIIMFIWKTANYVYSEMKITLNDGETIRYSCSPQMCRVHKHYLRLLKRDEKGTITHERHINESAIKQIEYS